VSRLCGGGSPFAVGARGQFVNVGESQFRVTGDAMTLGANVLCKLSASNVDEEFGRIDDATLVFFPPGCMAAKKGRVLVCSNFHWLCNAHYWLGGTLKAGDCARILLNFFAGAVAARVPPPLQ